MVNLYIQPYLWKKKEIKLFNKNLYEHITIKNTQFYNPIYSLYLYYHNTANSKQILDIYKNKVLKLITNSYEHKNYNSNKLLKGYIFNNSNNSLQEKDIFCKIIPLLDPMNYIMNNYSLNYNNILLPSNYKYNLFSKLNSIENSAYIENLFSIISNYLCDNNILPFLPLSYGSVTGINTLFKYDISEEYIHFVNEKWFRKNLGKLFTLDIYSYTDSNTSSDTGSNTSSDTGSNTSSDTGSDTDLNTSSDIDSDTGSNSKSSYISNNSNFSNQSKYSYTSSNIYNYDECICNIRDMPVMSIFVEKLDGTFNKVIFDNTNKCINYKLINSAMFQIVFSLLFLQKHFNFCHNDLHINNIMYKKTKSKFFYFKYNNKYFKVPTYGKIFKIIDFGRSIFKFKNKTFYNDVFSKYGEAHGQYNYPSQINFDTDKYPKVNYSFDICRLAITIYEEVNDYKIDKNNEEFQEFNTIFTKIMTDKNNNNLYKNNDDFQLYIDITNNCTNGLPYNLIHNKYFKKYLVKKKNMPKKYYSIN